jgi:hypothetical protein
MSQEHHPVQQQQQQNNQPNNKKKKNNNVETPIIITTTTTSTNNKPPPSRTKRILSRLKDLAVKALFPQGSLEFMREEYDERNLRLQQQQQQQQNASDGGSLPSQNSVSSLPSPLLGTNSQSRSHNNTNTNNNSTANKKDLLLEPSYILTNKNNTERLIWVGGTRERPASEDYEENIDEMDKS